jgi:hypothetical protein
VHCQHKESKELKLLGEGKRNAYPTVGTLRVIKANGGVYFRRDRSYLSTRSAVAGARQQQSDCSHAAAGEAGGKVLEVVMPLSPEPVLGAARLCVALCR